MKRTDKLNKYLLSGFVLIYLVVLLKTAWICDDAYISFRSMENFIHGYGLVHNIGERVQTFTHPLWFFVLSTANYFFQKILDLDYWSQMYYIAVFISIIVSATTILLICLLVAKSHRGATLALVLLLSSSAFMDYSTSGLENALTHLLLVLFLFLFLEERWSKVTKLLMLSFIAALGALNRLDTILLFIPALIYELFGSKDKLKSILLMILGFIPVILWELFSLFYYGSLFPNTAYAKLRTGISQWALLRQGFYYYLDSLLTDPITLISIIGVLIFIFLKKQQKSIPIGIAILLYMGYIFYIGGDFMSGRFFSSCVLAAAVILSRFNTLENFPVYSILVVFTLSVGLMRYNSPIRTPLTYGGDNGIYYINSWGIADERAIYFPNMGLLSTIREDAIPGSRFSGKDWVYDEKKRRVKVIGPLGVEGYSYGPNVHLIDRNSLSDPLMSRLPIIDLDNWRIGHYRHQIPKGYFQSLETGINQIDDPSLAKYYETLKFIIGGDLFNEDRIEKIIPFAFGKYDYLIEAYLSSRKN